MEITRDARFKSIALRLGYEIETEFTTAGSYVPAVQHNGIAHVSGQIPLRSNGRVVVGRVGEEVSLNEAYVAAQLCALRSLAVVRSLYGSLNSVATILRLGVYVRCGPSFGEISKVANGSSDVLAEIFQEAGIHARTSVGVDRLPRESVVEVELSVGLNPGVTMSLTGSS